MTITKTKGISIGVLALIIPLIAGSVIWYDDRQTDEHKVIEAKAVAQDMMVSQVAYESNRDVELELIEAKLKRYRVIEERRELSADEAADEEWLKTRKGILLQEQRDRRT